MEKYAVGLDIGGSCIKLGVVELISGKVLASEVFATERHDEEVFYENIKDNLRLLLKKLSMDVKQLDGVGISIGSYVYASDSSIDGMSCFVRFMTYGYPLKKKIEEVLNLPAKIDNDARLIGLSEAKYGAGRGFNRVLTLTLGTGIGVGMSTEGHQASDEAIFHMAGHIRVRDKEEFNWLDVPECYCGINGCFESTCSGSALEIHVHHMLGKEISNREMFQMAELKIPAAVDCVNWYIEMLSRGLNQYVYIYCPDVIVLGGGVSNALAPWLTDIQKNITAKVNQKQETVIRLAELKENGGIIGSSALFMC
jgi:glucokinase